MMLETVYIDVRQLERVWSMVTQSENLEYQDVAGKVMDRIISQMKRTDQI